MKKFSDIEKFAKVMSMVWAMFPDDKYSKMRHEIWAIIDYEINKNQNKNDKTTKHRKKSS